MNWIILYRYHVKEHIANRFWQLKNQKYHLRQKSLITIEETAELKFISRLSE